MILTHAHMHAGWWSCSSPTMRGATWTWQCPSRLALTRMRRTPQGLPSDTISNSSIRTYRKPNLLNSWLLLLLFIVLKRIDGWLNCQITINLYRRMKCWYIVIETLTVVLYTVCVEYEVMWCNMLKVFDGLWVRLILHMNQVNLASQLCL